MNEGGFSSTAAALIFEDIGIQATSFNKVEFSFCPRNAKKVAHVLDKECATQPSVWFEEPPILSLYWWMM